MNVTAASGSQGWELMAVQLANQQQKVQGQQIAQLIASAAPTAVSEPSSPVVMGALGGNIDTYA